LGMVPVPEKVASGEFHHNMGMYRDPEAAKHTLELRTSLPLGEVIGVAAAPWPRHPGPDVVVITALPEQVFWLIPAAQTFEEGGGSPWRWRRCRRAAWM